MNGRTPRILIVDDNPSDVAIMDIMLKEAGLSFLLEVCDDGEKASRRLSGAEPGAAPLDLVLLDLNLPRKSGRVLLEELRSNPAMADLPVIILTSAASPEERDAFQRFRNTACLIKPYLLGEYAGIVQTIRATLAGAQIPR